jgi:hypothetical protein
VDEDLLDDMARQVQAKPDKVRRRKSIIEQPFGTVKHSVNQGYFLIRGLPNVRSEMSLTVLAYNIKRAIRLLGARELVAALQA